MSRDNELVCVIDNSPSKHGWYATVYCWDSYEGGFPGPVYWDVDGEWVTFGSARVPFHGLVAPARNVMPVVQYLDVACNTKEEAETLANELEGF